MAKVSKSSKKKASKSKAKISSSKGKFKIALQRNFDAVVPATDPSIAGYDVVYNPKLNSGQVRIRFSDGSSQIFDSLKDTTIGCLVTLLSQPQKSFSNGYLTVNA